ncbi:hypothetical protein OEI98_000939 [Thermoanaerobacter sp. RKWS2]|nr:hypothetical protein OEI98_000939 [Thermoanaerobacter sp. RKWS2]
MAKFLEKHIYFFKVYYNHAEYGAEICKGIGLNERIVGIVRHHHDKNLMDEDVIKLQEADKKIKDREFSLSQFVDKVKKYSKEIFCIVAPMFQSDKTKARSSDSGRVPPSGGIHALRCPPPPSMASALPPPSALLSFPALK